MAELTGAFSGWVSAHFPFSDANQGAELAMQHLGQQPMFGTQLEARTSRHTALDSTCCKPGCLGVVRINSYPHPHNAWAHLCYLGCETGPDMHVSQKESGRPNR